jgi:diguanylate cyclase (GGDEF)-like protein
MSILAMLIILALIISVIFYFFMQLKMKKSTSLLQTKSLDIANSDSNRCSEMLSVMDEVDRAILSNASFERVLESLLPHLLTLIPCSLVAVTQLDKEVTDVSGTLVLSQVGKQENYPAKLEKPLKRILDETPDGYLLAPTETYPSLEKLYQLGAVRILLLPIYRDAKLSAVLSLGFAEHEQISDDAHQVARYFADRLGVALTAAMRAKNLHFQEYFDQITTLPNRRACSERLSLEISRANRNQLRIATLYISLDGFKKVNDVAGYAGGDAVLKQVANRLRAHLREADLIARFSNDEFVVILPDMDKATGVSKVAEKLIGVLSQSYDYNDHRYYLNSSVGISIYPEDGQTVDTLLQNADIAMARIKAKGPGQYMFHEEQMNSFAAGRLKLERDLRKAIKRNELFLVYQPQIDLRKNVIVGVEALVRWKHPTRGLLSPAEFIAIAEESDLIDILGAYVRQSACAQYQIWQTRGIAPPKISINVSGKELMRSSFADEFMQTLSDSGIKPTSMELEITESLLVDISGPVNAALQHLRQEGVRIAVDDFGTGYSSLSYLSQLPFDVLKIDQSFVAEIGKPLETYGIVSVIIDIAHHLRKTVCAEGVENEAQLAFLRERGCETVQGFLLSKPLSAEDYENFSNQQQSSYKI